MVRGSAGSLPSAPSPPVPFPTTSVLLLPPVDDVVLMKVLQALEDLQDDTLHLETENRSTDLCESSSSQASPQRLNPLECPVVCHCSAVHQSLCPPRVDHRLYGDTFFS